MDLKQTLTEQHCDCVLFVDDAPEIRDFMMRILRRYFSQVLIAANGKEALELYTAQKVDFIITDLLMPAMDGWQLGQAIWAINSLAKIIFLTGVGADEMLVDSSGRKIYYLVKPLHLAQLQTKIQEVLTDTCFN